jgi:hypothetical protein
MLGFGRDVCGDLGLSAGREWLVTNGMGGYASGMVSGVLPCHTVGATLWYSVASPRLGAWPSCCRPGRRPWIQTPEEGRESCEGLGDDR